MTGYEFRDYRKGKGLLQAEVAKALDLSPKSISKIESRKEKQAKINSDHWPVLAKLFGIPVSKFYPSQSVNKQSISGSPGAVVSNAGGDSNVVCSSDTSINLTPLLSN